MDKDILLTKIQQIKDPTRHQTLGDTSGIKFIEIKDDGVVHVEIYLADVLKDSAKVKLEMTRLVKLDLQFPGIKIQFFNDKDKDKNKNEDIIYVGIVSGKGGVGKSTATVQLAFAFMSLGHQVGIIDADIHGASIPSILEIEIEPIEQTKDNKMIPLSKHGIEVISTEFFMSKEKPLMWRGPMLGKMLIHFFNDVLWHPKTKYVFIDFPPGTGDVALDVQTLAPKTKMIVITTPHPNASMIAVKAGLGAKQIGHEVIGVIENMSYFKCPYSDEKIPIFGIGGGEVVSQMLGVEVLDCIPMYDGDAFFDHEDRIHQSYLKIANKIMTLTSI